MWISLFLWRNMLFYYISDVYAQCGQDTNVSKKVLIK